MPSKLTYGTSLFVIGVGLTETNAQEFLLKIGGKTDGKDTISAPRDCGDNNVYLQPENADSLSQTMNLTNTGNGYTIVAGDQRGNCSRKFMSVAGNCGQTYIDWYSRNDGSGRQLWNLISAGNGQLNFAITKGRENCDRNMISTRAVWDRVDLWKNDDNSGRQKIRIVQVVPPPAINAPSNAIISSIGKTDKKVELAASGKCGDQTAYLTEIENNGLDHNWKMVKLDNKNNYNIISNRDCQRKFLSVGAGCNETYVDLWNRDDNSGRQKWQIQPVSSRQGAYTFSVGGRNCDRVHLSTRDVWDRIDLWSAKLNDNQWYTMKPWTAWAPEPVSFSDKVNIRSLGKTDDKHDLVGTVTCDHQQFLANSSDSGKNHVWKMIPVNGKPNTYNIKMNRDCDRDFLSVGAGCGATYIDLWGRDDQSGRQQWQVTKVEGQANAYALRVGGRDCDRVYLSTRDVWDRADLWSAKDNNNQWWGITTYVPPTPIDVPQCSWISALGKTDDLTRLSWSLTGCDNNQRLSDPLDNGEQFSHEWNMIPVQGKVNTFNIVGKDNSCNRKFLSVGAECGATYVDLWMRDDNSGRQQWTVAQAAGNNGYTLTVGGRNCDRVHLSTRDIWDRVDLWSATNDNNQWYSIKACEPVVHEPVNAPACAHITALGKTDDKNALAADRQCNQHTAFLTNPSNIDNSFFGDWKMVAVNGKANTYNVIVTEKRESGNGCDRKFLSVGSGCGETYVDLWSRDDNSGRQQWTIRKVAGQSGAYTFTVGGRDCDRVHLSTRDVWDRVDLWSARNDNNQWFGISEGSCEWPIPEAIEINSCSTIASAGKTDDKDRLAAKLSQCGENGQFLINSAQRNQDFADEWNFEAVAGKVNTFTITAKGRDCGRKFLSVAAACGQTYVDLWNRDDNSGRQQWTVAAVAGQPNVLTLTVGGRGGCDRIHLSTRDVWDRVDLWSAKDNNNQWFAINECVEEVIEEVGIPACGTIASQGKTDGKTHLGFNNKNCNNRNWLGQPGADKKNQNFAFNPVEGKENTYNIVSKRGNCNRNYLSVAAGCGQTYVDSWHRDDNSGRQQWTIEKAANGGYTLIVGGRNGCNRDMLSTRAVWNRADLWKQNDNSGRQVWSIAQCASDIEPVDITDAGDNDAFWWRNPKWNNWNWGPNWQAPSWNWNANQGTNWRQWWRNRPTRAQWGGLKFNWNTNFRFWFRFSRDNLWLRPASFKIGAKINFNSETGDSTVFRGGEGWAWDWIQLEGLRGWGLLKVTGHDFYLHPINVNGRIRNGSPVELTDKWTWRCLWFWNGRRFRHISGRWLRVNDQDILIVQRRFGGKKSIFELVGPDESPLENFPGVAYIPDNLIWDEDEVNEEDEALPEDTIADDLAKDTPDEDDNEVEDHDADDLSFDEEDEDEEDVDDQNDAEEIDEEDGEEFDEADLPLEAGKIFIVEPSSDGTIPLGNCCNPVSRKKEAVAFTAASVATFAGNYGAQIGRGNSMIFTYIAGAFERYPNSMNPIKVFSLGNKAPEDNTMVQLTRHFAANSLAQTEGMNKNQARRVMRKIVANMESQLEIIDFAIEMMKAAEDPKLNSFEKNAKIMHQNVENFYKQALKPHRFAYKVYSKVPLSNGTVATLQDNMQAKLGEFKTALAAMNAGGLGYNPTVALRRINRLSGKITNRGGYRRLRRVLRLSRGIMVQINKRVVQKGLNMNATFVVSYEQGANTLFRANDSRSVRCYAIWALKRRHIHAHNFEKNIVNSGVQNKYNVAATFGQVETAMAAIKVGEPNNAVDHLAKQKRDVNNYIDAVFQVTLELGQRNWSQHTSKEDVKPSAGAFYVRYYTRMGNWRYALKNVAL